MPKYRIDVVLLVDADSAEEASEATWQGLGTVIDAHNAFQRVVREPEFDVEMFDYNCKGEVEDHTSEEFRQQVMDDFNR